MLSNPGLAARPCEECKKWVYREDGTRAVTRDGEPIPLRGKPPCYTCPKCDGEKTKSPETGKQAELSYRNWMTLKRYWEKKAGCEITEDGITRRNFGLIEWLIQSHKARQSRAMLEMLKVPRWPIAK